MSLEVIFRIIYICFHLVIESSSAQNARQHANTVSYNSPHVDAELELEKLRAMSLNSTNVTSNSSSVAVRQQPVSKNKPVEQLVTSPARDETDNVFTFTKTSSSSSTSSSQFSPTKTKPTRKVCERPSVATPDFMELEVAANRVRESIQDLRKDLSVLRKMHVDSTRHFKNDIQKKLLEFRKKANKVDDLLQSKIDQNNNSIFGKFLSLIFDFVYLQLFSQEISDARILI